MAKSMISKRIEANLCETSPMFAYMGRALSNAYHPVNNPNGIISLGIAENNVMSEDLAQFLSTSMQITPNLFGYGASAPGLPELFSGLLALYNSKSFNPVIPVESSHIYFTSGCTTLLDQIFWTTCDEGDGVLIGRPSYGGFVADMTARCKLKPIHVSLKGKNPFSIEAVQNYERELHRAERAGTKVRMLILCQPHNPLGRYVTKSEYQEY
jgi:aspartate/methionine/tyrosine aminotransferase